MPYIGNTSQKFVTADDVTVTDDLTVTDDATIGGDLAVTGTTTSTGSISTSNDLTISAGGTLDVFNSGNTSTDLTALLGADNGGGHGRTNSTNKTTVIGMPHYTNAQEPVGLIVAGSLSGENFIEIGGGGSVINAATSVSIRTASDTTTTGGTKQLTVNSSGDIDVETGDIFFSTAGKGIVLGATSNTAANTLDDYEEGAVTLTMQGANGNPSSTQTISGSYTKVGNMISLRAGAASGINNTGAQGPIQWTGLPFAHNGINGLGVVEALKNATFTNTPYAFAGGTTVYILQNISEGNYQNVNHHVDTNGGFQINVVYQTA